MILTPFLDSIYTYLPKMRMDFPLLQNGYRTFCYLPVQEVVEGGCDSLVNLYLHNYEKS